MDKADERILEILNRSKGVNLSELWIKSYSREGQKTFRERLDRLEKLNLIEIGTFPWRSGLGYLIRIKNGRS